MLLMFLIPLIGQSPMDWLRGGDEPVPSAEEIAEEVAEETASPEEGESASDLESGESENHVEPVVETARERVGVYVVPIEGPISRPNEYILRRSIKQAIENNIDVLILDLDTPGGRLDITLNMMEMIDRFPGETIAFVNKDAISAGAFISMVTDAIYFAPDGVMGAAAVVASTGQEIDPSMKAKINSYLQARMRSYTQEHPYRGQVIRAMAELDFVFEIDGEVIKPEGELLSLTGKEAIKKYGNPPRPLLAEGIARDVEDLLNIRFGEGNAEVMSFEVTWSEEVAKYLDAISPLLLAIGFLALFVEFKTPGFGIPGIVGIGMILAVFASNYIAGLAGFEAVLFFLLGLVFIAVEIFLLPGTLIFLIVGLLLVFGAVIWSMTDIWPILPKPGEDGGGYSIDFDSAWAAFYEVTGALALALIGLVLIWKFLPKTPAFARIVHQSVSPSPDPVVARGGSVTGGSDALPDIGAKGVVARPLHPVGQVLIDGKPYEATVAVGSLDIGVEVTVVGYRNFALLVEEDRS